MSSRCVAALLLPTILTANFVGITSLPSVASQVIPTVKVQQGELSANAPDWNTLTFATLPKLSQAGVVGTRSWQQGQALDQVLTLGDFASTFRLQDLNLFAIALATQTAPAAVKLSDFKLFKQQTLMGLAQAMPELSQEPINKVVLLRDRLQIVFPRPDLNRTLAEVIADDPQLGTVNFTNFDLSRYTLNDVPGLLTVPLQHLQSWQFALIDDIPALKDLPWSGFPGAPKVDGLIATVQMPQTIGSTTSISGSDVAGLQVPCNQAFCTSIQLNGVEPLHQALWLSGSQFVDGGHGKGAQLNDGKEPTGRYVFGEAFKVVLSKVTKESAQTSLYFRVCQAVEGEQACSPYAVGPIPFLNYRPGDGMVIGTVAATPVAPTATPSEAPDQQVIPIVQPSPPQESLRTYVIAWAGALLHWLGNVFQ